jgi:3-oxoadipate enol-lactonase
LISLEESESMARLIPGSTLVIIPEAGHLAPLENPGATDSAILGFLESLW